MYTYSLPFNVGTHTLKEIVRRDVARFISFYAHYCSMARDRMPLNSDRGMHGEPFITSADYIKSRQDKSKMPWPDESQGRTDARGNADTSRTPSPADTGAARGSGGRAESAEITPDRGNEVRLNPGQQTRTPEQGRNQRQNRPNRDRQSQQPDPQQPSSNQNFRDGPSQQSQKRRKPQNPPGEEGPDEGPDPGELEDKAVRHVIRKLRDKGVSERFIHQNMAEIRERARRELMEQD